MSDERSETINVSFTKHQYNLVQRATTGADADMETFIRVSALLYATNPSTELSSEVFLWLTEFRIELAEREAAGQRTDWVELTPHDKTILRGATLEEITPDRYDMLLSRGVRDAFPSLFGVRINNWDAKKRTWCSEADSSEIET